jgi:sigma-B regulation protein RsbU (phosphoserine phosphatase)
MNGLNNLIYETFPFERFVTLCYIELTTSSNRLVLYANAGHCPPIHFRAESEEIRLLDSTGGLLGLMENQKFRVENIRMRPGDVLVMYTDGIIECSDRNGQLFGEERLYQLIRKHHKDNPKNIAAYVFDEVQRWSVGSSYTDDKTLVIIKRDMATQ